MSCILKNSTTFLDNTKIYRKFLKIQRKFWYDQDTIAFVMSFGIGYLKNLCQAGVTHDVKQA